MSDPIVDTHTHVVSFDHDRYPISPPEGLPRMPWIDEHPVDAAGLLDALDAGGVSGAVLVQAKGAYGFDNSYAADATQLAPDRFVSASIIDMNAPDRIAQLEHWTLERGMTATRLFDIPTSSPPWLDDPATAPVLARIAELGVHVALCVLVESIPRVGALCAMAPDLPIALDHCGFADLSGPTPELDALAPHPNLRLKVTTTAFETATDPRDSLERLCEVFGVERLMWGSDYPQHHSEPYPEIVDLARHACSRLTASEQARFLGGTALDLFPELSPEPAP
jgi:predicted TIM-barrel fold metal-dependent hydrolase